MLNVVPGLPNSASIAWKNGLISSIPSEWTIGRKQDGPRRIVGEDALEIALAKTLDVVVQDVGCRSHFYRIL